MKPKRLPKKLGLNKETVAHLNDKTMDRAKGGTWGTGTSCVPCETMSCNTACFFPETRCICSFDVCVSGMKCL